MSRAAHPRPRASRAVASLPCLRMPGGVLLDHLGLLVFGLNSPRARSSSTTKPAHSAMRPIRRKLTERSCGAAPELSRARPIRRSDARPATRSSQQPSSGGPYGAQTFRSSGLLALHQSNMVKRKAKASPLVSPERARRGQAGQTRPRAPLCQNCHGSHRILSPTATESQVSRKNVTDLFLMHVTAKISRANEEQ